MLTPEQELKQKKDVIEGNIAFCEDTLKKAEKYERLKGNPDWEGVLEDIKVVIGIHQREVEEAQKLLVQQNPFRRIRTTDFIVEHLIRKTQLEEALQEQRRILEMADLARKSLPKLKEQLEKLEEVLTHA